MFDRYRDLLKIVCCKEWNTEKNHDELKKFLSVLENALDKKPVALVKIQIIFFCIIC